jgi:hypothetical protein
MAEALPIQENAKDLDKASILRVAINYLKLRDLVGENEPEESGDAAEKDGVAENGGATVKTEDSESEVGGSEDATETKKPSTQLPNFAKDVLQVK